MFIFSTRLKEINCFSRYINSILKNNIACPNSLSKEQKATFDSRCLDWFCYTLWSLYTRNHFCCVPIFPQSSPLLCWGSSSPVAFVQNRAHFVPGVHQNCEELPIYLLNQTLMCSRWFWWKGKKKKKKRMERGSKGLYKQRLRGKP